MQLDFQLTSTLQGLGAYPGEDNQFLGMLVCMELMKQIMRCMDVI